MALAHLGVYCNLVELHSEIGLPTFDHVEQIGVAERVGHENLIEHLHGVQKVLNPGLESLLSIGLGYLTGERTALKLRMASGTSHAHSRRACSLEW